MITIVFLETTDENWRQICIEFWKLDPDGDWSSTVPTIAKKFNQNPATLPSVVRKSAKAYAEDVLCFQCERPAEVVSRKAYEKMKGMDTYGRKRIGNNDKFCCEECKDTNAREYLINKNKQINENNKAIEHRLRTEAKNLAPMDYANASIKDAFLLYGFLSYLPEKISQGMLASPAYRPKLFAHLKDTHEAYIYLYKQKWIAPDPLSSRALFDISGSGEILINSAIDVNWVLAPDINGRNVLELLPLVENCLHEPSHGDLKFLWSWVCLSELRVVFEMVHYQWGFKSKGWTPLVEKNITMLLDECSIADAKAIVRGSMKKLKDLLQDTRYTKTHVYNMIPGSFLRFLNNLKANGKEIFGWDRQSLANEAIFTSLLFDKLIGSGSYAYKNYTGKHFDNGPL